MRGPKWLVELHNRTPLFVKVLGANGFFIVTGALGGYAIARFGLTGNDVLRFIAAGLIFTLVVNFALLRVAFAPLFRLHSVIEAVRSGEFTARSPQIPGDPDVSRLTEAFNLMLDRLNDYRQSVSSQILRALEDERKRIARELHDETSQALTSIIIAQEMVEQGLPEGDPLRDRVRFAREYTLRTLDEIRRLTFDLRPSILDDLGLVPAIRWYLKNRLAADGLHIYLEVAPEAEEVRLPEETEITLFRIVQEALTNVRKHSRATEVTVRIWLTPGRLHARVADNGIGFNTEEAFHADARGRGLGLLGMRERAALVKGANLRVESTSGRGSVVEVEVPVGG